MKSPRLVAWFFLASMVFAARLLAGAEAGPGATTPHEVSVPFSASFPLHCQSNDRDYDMYVRYPDGYHDEKNKDRRYPVVYICDAQWDFFLISGIYPTLLFDQKIEESILVGMAWGGKTSNYWVYRGIDYTPAPMAEHNPGGGGAEKALAALKTEIIPWVESHVRADPRRRILTGSSYGGMFVLYTLLTEPELFCGYLAPTPTVLYADNYLPRLEASSAGTRRPARGRLFMTAGERESAAWQQSILDFERVLASRKNDGLVIKTAIISGEGHSSQKAQAYARGLQFIFEK
jgi:uncharacterized protein